MRLIKGEEVPGFVIYRVDPARGAAKRPYSRYPLGVGTEGGRILLGVTMCCRHENG